MAARMDGSTGKIIAKIDQASDVDEKVKEATEDVVRWKTLKIIGTIVLVLCAIIGTMGGIIWADQTGKIEKNAAVDSLQNAEIAEVKDTVADVKLDVAVVKNDVKHLIRLMTLNLEALSVPQIMIDSAKNGHDKDSM